MDSSGIRLAIDYDWCEGRYSPFEPPASMAERAEKAFRERFGIMLESVFVNGRKVSKSQPWEDVDIVARLRPGIVFKNIPWVPVYEIDGDRFLFRLEEDSVSALEDEDRDF